MGVRFAAARPRRARFLGAERLPRPRRPMARAALPGRLRIMAPGPWQTASVVGIRPETAERRRFASDCPSRPSTSPVSTTSCALRPRTVTGDAFVLGGLGTRRGSTIELTVERLAGGEVSTFLHDEVVRGDELEVRGPVGGWFVWRAGTPALLVGGGSGVVPLMAMLRLARQRHLQDSAQAGCVGANTR